MCSQKMFLRKVLEITWESFTLTFLRITVNPEVLAKEHSTSYTELHKK